MRNRTYLSNALIIIGLVFISFNACAQYSFPRGVYFSERELMSKTPSIDYPFTVVNERSSGDIAMMGGNDYKIICEDVRKREVRRDWYAYSDGKELYLNCFRLGLQSFYAKAILNGYYIVFEAAMSADKAATTAFMFGAIGSAAMANNRYTYALELSTGSVTLLKKKTIQKLLSVDADILAQYNADPTNDVNRVVHYMQMINEKLASNVKDQSPLKDEKTQNRLSGKVVDLIVYRPKRRQLEQIAKLSIAYTIIHEFIPNSYVSLRLVCNSDSIDVCYIERKNCISVVFSSTSLQYVSCSITQKKPKTELEIVDDETGDWFTSLAMKAEKKRRKRNPTIN